VTHEQVIEAYLDGHKYEGKGSRIFFEGPVIYSYGRHFPMAYRISEGRKGRHRHVYLLNTESYSSTTSHHVSRLWSGMAKNKSTVIHAHLRDLRAITEYHVEDLALAGFWGLADPDEYPVRRVDEWQLSCAVREKPAPGYSPRAMYRGASQPGLSRAQLCLRWDERPCPRNALGLRTYEPMDTVVALLSSPEHEHILVLGSNLIKLSDKAELVAASSSDSFNRLLRLRDSLKPKQLLRAEKQAGAVSFRMGPWFLLKQEPPKDASKLLSKSLEIEHPWAGSRNNIKATFGIMDPKNPLVSGRIACGKQHVSLTKMEFYKPYPMEAKSIS
jgi:hypothetical protein